MSIFKSVDECLARFPRATESFFRRNVIGYKGGVSIIPASNEGAKMNTLKPVLTVGGRKAPVPSPKTPPRQPNEPKRARQKVPRTRNGGTWTEAEYWSRIRSCLRRLSRWWVPARQALFAARFPCKGPRGQKWAYICASCQKPFPRKQVHVDHRIPAGSLTSNSHLGDFLLRLTPESIEAFQVLCLTCHQEKTNAERAAK